MENAEQIDGKSNEVFSSIARSKDSEFTAYPFWLIINPKQMLKPDCHTVAGMITGPFFSRESAQNHLETRRYAFGKNAVVYCCSGYWSKDFCKVYDQSKKLNEIQGD
jgi:hypothetical protein